MVYKTEAELEAETIAFWRRAAKLPWASIAVCCVVVWFLRDSLWWVALVGLAMWLVYSYRDSPLAEWLRATIWDRLFRREEPSQALPFRPLISEPGPEIEREGFVPLPHIGWNGEPQNEQHGWYRTEYARIAQQLEGASQDAEGDGRRQRRDLVLYHAELLDALKLYGDNPLLSGAAPRLAAFAPVDAPQSFWARIPGALLSGLRAWQLYALGILAALAGWQFARAEVLDAKAEKSIEQRNAWAKYAVELEDAARNAARANAATIARVQQEAALSQKFLADERARRALQNRDIRRIAREASIDSGVPVEFGLRILAEPTDSGPGQDSPNPPAADSELQPGMPPSGGTGA